MYNGNTDGSLKGGKAHGWVAKICLRNSSPSKLEMNVVEKCEKIFLLSKVKMKFSVEQKIFIVRVYYATKLYKSVGRTILSRQSTNTM